MEFAPDYTPEQMLQMGVFGQSYFTGYDDMSGYTDDILILAKHNISEYDLNNNCYKATAGKDYKFWMERGWIFEEDPIGWFQWYCRYYSGRRHPRDDHQIRRWYLYKKRWLTRSRNEIRKHGKVSNVIKQGLLQWGIDWSQ